MKVFALVSGGKDSIFNIIKCQEQGHEIVALGNLYNLDETSESEGI
jgi:diphthine-ammonia ligase